MAPRMDSDWRPMLRAAGLRVTRPRLIVLELLGQLSGHHTAEEIYSSLSGDGSDLARGTVYNVLDDLVDKGLAMRADRGPGAAIYELAESWHHHFVCRDCGTVIDVECVEGNEPCVHTDVPGADVDEVQVIFRGRCADCVAER